MHIAVLGATSQIAKDFVRHCDRLNDFEFSLFARRPSVVSEWVAKSQLSCTNFVASLEDFGGGGGQFDAIVNFVGSGNPAQTAVMGSEILDITYHFDTLALAYVQKFPNCRYVFLSSGAAYGGMFHAPIDESTRSSFSINNLLPTDWYGMAKMHSEVRHRALSALPIVDVRVFSYFSREQDISSRFLVTDMLRAIIENKVMRVTSDFIVRDFLHPLDFYNLLMAIFNAPPTNTAIDCYTREPIDKIKLLENMQKSFGLQYAMGDGSECVINATGKKTHYYSLNRRAADFGYEASLTSWEGVYMESMAMFSGCK